VMVAITLVMTSVPALFSFLKTTWLPLNVWIIVLMVIFMSTFWIEARKALTT